VVSIQPYGMKKMIRFKCSSCNFQREISDKYRGQQVCCSRCQAPNQIGQEVIQDSAGAIIKFYCPKCGQKTKAPRDYVGKRIRCAKCQTPSVVPYASEEIRQSSAKSTEAVVQAAAGESGENDLENDLFGNSNELLQMEQQSKVVERPVEPVRASSESSESGSIGNIDGVGRKKKEAPSNRKLPWLIDILLYPASGQGLGNIAIIMLVQFLSIFLCIFGGIFNILIFAYMYWYFCECIRDSAVGGLRAPSSLGSERELLGEVWECLRLIACYLFFFGPVMFYRAYCLFSDIEMSGEIYWLLLSYGVFFFPMAILAVVMFGTINGANPILLIRSIISTFLQYCGFIVLFYGLGILYKAGVAVMTVSTVASVGSVSLGPKIMSFVFLLIATRVGFLWMLFVTGHLLGRFYWRYKEKLYWEV
jgi:hypothetical protein